MRTYLAYQNAPALQQRLVHLSGVEHVLPIHLPAGGLVLRQQFQHIDILLLLGMVFCGLIPLILQLQVHPTGVQQCIETLQRPRHHRRDHRRLPVGSGQIHQHFEMFRVVGKHRLQHHLQALVLLRSYDAVN